MYATNTTSYLGNFIELPDSGYLISGVNTYFTENASLIRTDKKGDTLWTKNYKIPPNGSNNIAKTQDNNFILSKRTKLTNTGWGGDFFMMKFDQNGDSLWCRYYGRYGTDDIPYFCYNTKKNRFFLGGLTEKTFGDYNIGYLLYLDEKGDTIWTKKYDFGNWSALSNIYEKSENEFYVSYGYFGLDNKNKAGLMKIDSSGNVLFSKIYGDELIINLPALFDFDKNTIYLSGRADFKGAGTDYDGFVLTLDDSGNVLWTKSYDRGVTKYESVNNISLCKNGLLAIYGGYTPADQSFSFPYIAKLDTMGNILWSRKYEYGEYRGGGLSNP